MNCDSNRTQVECNHVSYFFNIWVHFPYIFYYRLDKWLVFWKFVLVWNFLNKGFHITTYNHSFPQYLTMNTIKADFDPIVSTLSCRSLHSEKLIKQIELSDKYLLLALLLSWRVWFVLFTSSCLAFIMSYYKYVCHAMSSIRNGQSPELFCYGILTTNVFVLRKKKKTQGVPFLRCYCIRTQII